MPLRCAHIFHYKCVRETVCLAFARIAAQLAACLLQILRYSMVFTRSAMPKCPPAMRFHPTTAMHPTEFVRCGSCISLSAPLDQQKPLLFFHSLAIVCRVCVCVCGLFHCFCLFFLFCFRSFAIYGRSIWSHISAECNEQIRKRFESACESSLARARSHTRRTQQLTNLGTNYNSYPIRMEICTEKCRYTADARMWGRPQLFDSF